MRPPAGVTAPVRLPFVSMGAVGRSAARVVDPAADDLFLKLARGRDLLGVGRIRAAQVKVVGAKLHPDVCVRRIGLERRRVLIEPAAMPRIEPAVGPDQIGRRGGDGVASKARGKGVRVGLDPIEELGTVVGRGVVVKLEIPNA